MSSMDSAVGLTRAFSAESRDPSTEGNARGALALAFTLSSPHERTHRALDGPPEGGEVHDRHSLLYLYAGVAAVAVATLIDLYVFHNDWNLDLKLMISGLAFYLFGAIVRTKARLELGLLFTFQVKVMPDHKIKSDGLYAWVLHPGYSGLILEVIGWCLFCDTWFGALACVALFFPAMGFRIAIEEATLRGHFGPECDAYARRVKALVPGVV